MIEASQILARFPTYPQHIHVCVLYAHNYYYFVYIIIILVSCCLATKLKFLVVYQRCVCMVDHRVG